MLTMEEALKQSAMRFAAGEIVKGTIIEVRPKEVLVDIGYKSEGVIPANEFDDIKAVKVGDEIDVLIEKLEDKEGMVVLSKEKAEFKKNWEKILQICNEGGTVAGKVKAVVKGGLLVNIGVEAFLPASQIDIIPPKKDDGIADLKTLAAAASKEPNVLRYEVLQQNSRPNHFTVAEIWKNRAALDAHLITASTKAFRDKLLPMSGSLYDERLYRRIE